MIVNWRTAYYSRMIWHKCYRFMRQVGFWHKNESIYGSLSEDPLFSLYKIHQLGSFVPNSTDQYLFYDLPMNIIINIRNDAWRMT